MTLIVPEVASAENFYVAVRGGPGWTEDKDLGPVGETDVFTFGTGFTGGGAVGYSFPFGLRVEGEVGYLYAPLKHDNGVDVDGSTKSFQLMANAYYDLKLAALGPFKPYVGFGIGGARVNHDHEFFSDSRGIKIAIDEWRTAFAYQARAGIGYDVNQWLDLSLGYRYLHIDGDTRNVLGRSISFGSINNHSVELGFAIKF
jgi:opacity protein-like surface antigen